MNCETFKKGDIVRLTDPLSNGEVVRIEEVDEHGYASWLGGAQKGDMTQISVLSDGDSPIGNDIDGYFFLVSEIVEEIEKRVSGQTWLNLKRPFKLYPESAVNYWKHRAEIAEQSNALNEKLLKEEHNKLLDVQDNIEKLQSELSRCRAMNADYLTAKTEAENRAKLLKQEITDIKVPDSRRERHLRDELHRSRLERQQAWEHANKEMAENKELRERNEALKRQLDESNKQIEIYAKKVRNLEAELEEDGGLG